MRTVCDGEALLRAGRHAEAVGKFRQAAEMQRLQATNEIAWAGLAAAYCDGHDRRRGQEWATRFDEARRLWLGEWDCDSDATTLSPDRSFVRQHMCTETLAADYKFVRDHPGAAVSSEIVSHFAAVSKNIGQYCAGGSAKPVVESPTAKAPHMTTKAAKKNRRKKVSGKRASPGPGR